MKKVGIDDKQTQSGKKALMFGSRDATRATESEMETGTESSLAALPHVNDLYKPLLLRQ
jgi:hypothetical protein